MDFFIDFCIFECLCLWMFVNFSVVLLVSATFYWFVADFLYCFIDLVDFRVFLLLNLCWVLWSFINFVVNFSDSFIQCLLIFVIFHWVLLRAVVFHRCFLLAKLFIVLFLLCFVICARPGVDFLSFYCFCQCSLFCIVCLLISKVFVLFVVFIVA